MNVIKKLATGLAALFLTTFVSFVAGKILTILGFSGPPPIAMIFIGFCALLGTIAILIILYYMGEDILDAMGWE